MYVGLSAALCAEGFVLLGSSAIQCALVCALKFVGGSGSTSLDKFKFDLHVIIEQFMLSFANQII